MLEKPLTGTLEADRAFAAKLDRDHPDALMLASQRRFDEPLQYAKELLESGAIGRVFKIFFRPGRFQPRVRRLQERRHLARYVGAQRR